MGHDSRRRDSALVAAGMLLMAIAATWPLVRDAAVALPGDLGDPLLNSYILAWNADRMAHGFQGYWDAPFFFPLRGTLAFSEHLFGVAIFTAPLQWLTRNPVLVYNIAWLGSYVLAGVGMYLLALDLWGRRDAAWIAAVAFAFAPHRAAHLSHLQVLVSGWMPISLWCLHRFVRTGSVRALAGFAAAFCLNGLSNGYFLYFFTIATGVVGGCEVVRALVSPEATARDRLRSLRFLALRLTAAACAIAVVLAPFANGYLDVRRRYGFRRGLDEIAANSGHLRDALHVSGHTWFWDTWLPVSGPEFVLFPGLATLVLALAALAWLRRTTVEDPHGHARQRVVIYGVLAVVAAWLALGPGAWRPYSLLLNVVPGMDGLRVPARLITIVALALAALAGAGFARVASRLSPRTARRAALLLTLAIVAEGAGAPVPTVRFDPWQRQRQRTNAWLAAQPPGAVLELPVAGPMLEPFTLVHQYNALAHGHPVVNGYSGYGSMLQDFLGGPVSPLNDSDQVSSALDGLRRIGVQYVVLNRRPWDEWPGWRPEELTSAIESATDQVAEERYFTGTRAFRLRPSIRPEPLDARVLVRLEPGVFSISASALTERLPAAFDRDLRTRWFTGTPQTGHEWIRIEFPRETNVGRLVFSADAQGVGDYPRRLSIEVEAADGVTRTVFAGSIVAHLIQGIARTANRPEAVIDLPDNAARVLWIRQVGTTRTWYWGINEMALFRRVRP